MARRIVNSKAKNKEPTFMPACEGLQTRKRDQNAARLVAFSSQLSAFSRAAPIAGWQDSPDTLSIGAAQPQEVFGFDSTPV